MKIQKITKTILILGIALISVGVYAQPGGDRGQEGPPKLPSDKEIVTMVSDLATDIDLSDLQEATVLQLYKDHFTEVKEKTKSGRPKREEMESLKSDFEAKVKEALTEDQEKLYINYLKKNQSPKRKMR
ncbi:hypothetical protein [Aureibaculum luteum]|uniref:hypothetical protein n=1 Tax=Aureibaculum luteum TaxID=1548456 RepID=UPI000E47EECF|nr:hypothetical protein [Aureibaculum luteum]